MSQWIIQISAGTGPAEARAFAGRLAEHMQAECEARGVRVLEVVTTGDEDAPRSVEILVEGPAPAALAEHIGTHALVARSAHRGRDARKRWFVGLSVHAAEPAAEPAPALDPREVAMRADRAGGPGGQHVNRTASAVRAVHLPTGVAVRVVDTRSQHANRRRALARLAELVAARAAAASAHMTSTRRREHYAFARGNAVKTWRMDHRDRGLVAHISR